VSWLGLEIRSPRLEGTRALHVEPPVVNYPVTEMTQALLGSYRRHGGINHLDGVNLPSRARVEPKVLTRPRQAIALVMAPTLDRRRHRPATEMGTGPSGDRDGAGEHDAAVLIEFTPRVGHEIGDRRVIDVEAGLDDG